MLRSTTSSVAAGKPINQLAGQSATMMVTNRFAHYMNNLYSTALFVLWYLWRRIVHCYSGNRLLNVCACVFCVAAAQNTMGKSLLSVLGLSCAAAALAFHQRKRAVPWRTFTQHSTESKKTNHGMYEMVNTFMNDWIMRVHLQLREESEHGHEKLMAKVYKTVVFSAFHSHAHHTVTWCIIFKILNSKQ